MVLGGKFHFLTVQICFYAPHTLLGEGHIAINRVVTSLAGWCSSRSWVVANCVSQAYSCYWTL